MGSVCTMMFTILASSLVLLAAVTEGKPHESEWQTYKAIHGKEYSREEDLMRFSRWLQNKEMVDAHNKADHGYKMALMEHSDWTEEEMNERRLGFAPSPAFYEMEEDSFEDVTGPNELDHRNSGLVTGVKNQGQLVDCGPGSCQGGMMDSAWDTARNGIETEAAYPYVGRDQSCRFNPSKAVAHTAGHRRVSASESSLESAIYSVGYPISVAVHVGSSFQHYSHGVFSDPSCRYGQL